MLTVLLSWPATAVAAELLQVRTATLLQIGDGNRNYAVELACIGVEPDDQAAAMAWLRQELPRRTRVNLRPLGEQGGLLLARVSRLNGERDMGSGLIAAGLAHPETGSKSCSLLGPG
ncbi:MAG: hypothetical protein WAM11_01850 [Cyanobium sp.]